MVSIGSCMQKTGFADVTKLIQWYPRLICLYLHSDWSKLCFVFLIMYSPHQLTLWSYLFWFQQTMRKCKTLNQFWKSLYLRFTSNSQLTSDILNVAGLYDRWPLLCKSSTWHFNSFVAGPWHLLKNRDVNVSIAPGLLSMASITTSVPSTYLSCPAEGMN